VALRHTTATGTDGREPLTRVRILDCALAMIDRDGLENLSMRRLAAELDVSAMSLYNHVPNKDALLEGVKERLLAEVDLSAAELDDWSEAIREGFKSFRRALLAHPNALPLIESKPLMTPEAFRPVELSLATLRRGGFAPDEALKAHFALVGYTLGHAAFQLANPLHEQSSGELDRISSQEMGEPMGFHNLLECLPHAAEWEPDEAYDFGLDILIAGLKARLAE
jgi:AcrR family transcriptional regulator